MLSLAVNGYTEEAVKNALHYQSERRVSFRYELIDGNNIPKGSLEVAPGGSITFDADADIKRVGKYLIKEDERINWQTDKIRPYFQLTMPDGGVCEWPLGTFYMPTPRKAKGIAGMWYDVDAYDMTYIFSSDSTAQRTYYPKLTYYVDAVSSILIDSGILNAIVTQSSLQLQNDREWLLDTKKLDIIKPLLTEMNYDDLFADANGIMIAQPFIHPGDRVADYTYQNNEFSVLYEGASTLRDDFDVPNVVIGIVNNPDIGNEMSYVYTNIDPASPVSIPARNGRRVTKKVEFEDIASLADLQAATTRYANTVTEVYEQATYETALMPHHGYHDLLYLQNDTLDGRYLETSWSMTLKAGERMRHTAKKLVIL